MECPRCHSMNPDTALRCVCGYDFAPRPMQELPSRIVPSQALPKGVLALALTGAIPLTLAGLAAALFIFAFSDDPNVPLIGWLLRAGGVLAVFDVLAWLPLWAAWTLSNRKKRGWAYAVAAIPPVTFVVLLLAFHNWVTHY